MLMINLEIVHNKQSFEGVVNKYFYEASYFYAYVCVDDGFVQGIRINYADCSNTRDMELLSDFYKCATDGGV